MADARRTHEDGPAWDAPDEGARSEVVWDVVWDADAVRALRAQLGLTQADFADRIGTRQQTVSEWETGASTPRRMSRRLLRMVAEDAGFYDAAPPSPDSTDSTSPEPTSTSRQGPRRAARRKRR